MAALSAKPVSPRSLNPYRQKRTENYGVDEIERSHRVHKMGGRHIEQVIPMSQVVNDA